MAAKRAKYNPEEVQDLINRVNGLPTSGKYYWVEKLTAEQAVEELVKRFQPLIEACLRPLETGIWGGRHRGNYSQTKFLELFVSSSTPLDRIALALKKETAHLTSEELRMIGNIAIRKAIRKTTKSLTGTIVVTLKEEIYEITKNQNKDKISPITHAEQTQDPRVTDHIHDLELETLINSCDLNDQIVIYEILEGKRRSLRGIPEGQRNRLKEIFSYLHLD